jgi:hypothetical protein
MGKALDITDEQRERVGQQIENGLEFTRDVLNGPSILDHIPNGSTVKAIPIAERDPNVHYDIETPRYLAIVTPGGMDTPPSAKQANGHPRRIERDEATRLKRIRAARR